MAHIHHLSLFLFIQIIEKYTLIFLDLEYKMYVRVKGCIKSIYMNLEKYNDNNPIEHFHSIPYKHGTDPIVELKMVCQLGFVPFECLVKDVFINFHVCYT